MDSFTKFTKASLGFYNDIIGDFSKRVKEAIPEEYHSAIDELMVSNQKMLDDAKKVNNKMKKKTTPTKKKAPSGWNLFYKEHQSSVEATKQENKMSLVSEMWNALSDEDREVWKNKAKALSDTSDSASDSEATSDSTSDNTSDSEAKSESASEPDAPVKKGGGKKGAKKGAAKKSPKKGKTAEKTVESDSEAVEDDMPIMDASD